MNIIVLFGPPGVGKGTQAELLAKYSGFVHISTGRILREAIAQRTEIGKKIENIVSKGQLVHDEIIIEVIKDYLNKHKNSNGFIMDGFPRTLKQAELFEKIVPSSSITVISLTADEEELKNRLIKRNKLENRTDDNEETIKERFEVYRKQTIPVLEFYKNKAKLFFVNGMGPIESIHEAITYTFDSLGL